MATFSRALALCALASLLIAVPARAYVRETTSTGRGLYWDRSRFPIPFRLDDTPAAPGGTANRQVIIDQFQVWQNASCAQFSVTTSPTTVAHSSARATSDNLSTIYWTTSWSYGSGVLGVTTPWFDNSSGVISEADMQFNAHDWTWETPSQYSGCLSTSNGCADTASIALHEEGHFLGLDHSSVRAAVMYASWDGSAKRALTSDDVSGICAIYPRQSQGTGTQGAGCVSSSNCISTLICGTPASGGASICTKSCTGTSDTSCPSGDTCQAKSGGGYGCFLAPTVMDGGSAATIGEPCGNTDCAAGLVCAGMTVSDATCHQGCTPGGTNTCPSGQICYDFGNGTGACLDSGNSGGTAGVGQSCGSVACQSGLICVGSSALDATCRQECGTGIGACPSGQQCVPLSGESSGACFPGSTSNGTVQQCQTCTTNADCVSGLSCVALSTTQKICRKACSTDSACGSNTQCVPSNTSGTTEVCACAADTASVATGQRCAADNFCKNGLICVDDGSSDGPVCRGKCTLGSSECSAGLECREFGSEAACVMPEVTAADAGFTDERVPTSGCTCASADPMELGLILAAFGALTGRRRRRAL